MTSTRPVARSWARSLPGLLVGGALLAGLLAMHGLGGHGAGHQQAHDAADVTAAAAAHDDHMSAAGAPTGAQADGSADSQLPAPDTSALGICVAVLAGAVLLLAGGRLLSHTGNGLRRASAANHAPLRALVRRWPEHPPVCLHALSIQRC